MGEEKPALFRGSGTAETRPGSLAGIRDERELWDEQQSAVDIPQGAVHTSLFIRKHSISQEPLQETTRPSFIVTAFNTHKNHQATVDCAHSMPIDIHMGGGHPLQQADHFSRPAISMVAATSSWRIPDSVMAWPTPPMMRRSAAGHACLSSQA